MAEPTTKTEILKTHSAELTKVYNVYDAYNRIEYTYTAIDTATHGSWCMATRFSYDGISSRITFAKEFYAQWDSSWDAF